MGRKGFKKRDCLQLSYLANRVVTPETTKQPGELFVSLQLQGLVTSPWRFFPVKVKFAQGSS